MLALCVTLAAFLAPRAAAIRKPEPPAATAPFTAEAPVTVPFALVVDENGMPVTVADAVPETDADGSAMTAYADMPVTNEAGEPVTDGAGEAVTQRLGMPVTKTSRPTDPTEPATVFLDNPAVRGSLAGGTVIALAAVAFLVLQTLKSKPAHAKEKEDKHGGVRLSADKLSAGKLSVGNLSVGNLAHIGRRDSQQDSFGVSDIADEALVAAKGVLAVVADGIGGLQGGAEVSSAVTSHFMQNFAALPAQLTPPEQLLRLTQEANRKSPGHAQGGLSGSTLVAAILKDARLWFVSVGDSRIYLLREGALVQLNREHTKASELDEDAARGRITVEEARGDRQRGALTSFIGMGELRRIDRNLRPIALQPGDRVLLMTDGVFGTLGDEEMLAILAADTPCDAAAAREQAVLAKHKPRQDNFTAIILGM